MTAARSQFDDLDDARRQLQRLRRQLEKAYHPDTAAPGFRGSTPSTGQCAATSVIVRERLGGDMVSARVDGVSHWFNRLLVKGELVDADITGDQFGRPPIQIAAVGKLYADTQRRSPEHLNEETLRRTRLLAERAGEKDVEASMVAALNKRRHDLGTL